MKYRFGLILALLLLFSATAMIAQELKMKFTKITGSNSEEVYPIVMNALLQKNSALNERELTAAIFKRCYVDEFSNEQSVRISTTIHLAN